MAAILVLDDAHDLSGRQEIRRLFAPRDAPRDRNLDLRAHLERLQAWERGAAAADIVALDDLLERDAVRVHATNGDR